jgi:hypothetical protein
MFWNFISSLPVKRGGSISFLVGTISNVLVMEIGWTDVGIGGYILVSCAHSNTSFYLPRMILSKKLFFHKKKEGRSGCHCVIIFDILIFRLFEDVGPNLQQIVEIGIAVYVYSSGSVESQKLLFANTDDGNLLEVCTNIICICCILNNFLINNNLAKFQLHLLCTKHANSLK